jgi:hypothetical protein
MRLLLVCAVLLPAIAAIAQEATPRPPFTLKIAPLDLINPFQQSVTVLADIPVAARWAVELGAGYFFHSASLARFEGERFEGWRVKPAVKYYTRRTERTFHYFALAMKYHDVYNDRYLNILRQGAQYTEVVVRRRHRTTWGAGLRFGSQLFTGARRNFVFDLSIGLGLRQLRVTDDALPPDAEALEETGFFNGDRPPGVYTTPDLLLGFSLGWKLSN